MPISEVSSRKKTLIDHKINIPLSEAEYVALAAIVRALKPIQLGSEDFQLFSELCRRDVTVLSAEGVFSFIIEELRELSLAFSLKLMKH